MISEVQCNTGKLFLLFPENWGGCRLSIVITATVVTKLEQGHFPPGILIHTSGKEVNDLTIFLRPRQEKLL